MTKLGMSVAHIQSDRCAKKNCTRRAVHRHHRAHEWMWVKILERIKSPRFKSFRDRYFEFRKEDVVNICEEHHKEIHFLYNVLIQCHKSKCGVGFNAYTWDQALDLMRLLREFCAVWLTIFTPRANANVYFSQRIRTRYRSQNSEDSLDRRSSRD